MIRISHTVFESKRVVRRLLNEIRWHGRAGQGIITVSRLLAQAAMMEGKNVQAFPEFGPERIGAPISGFTRISDDPIQIHSKIYEPDIVVVLDPTIIGLVNVTEGLKEKGKFIVNSNETPEKISSQLGLKGKSIFNLDGTRISLDVLGSAKAINTVMLGALVKASNLVSLVSVQKALEERFSGPILEKNLEMIKKGFDETGGEKE